MLSKQTNIIIICTNILIYDHLRGERLKTVEIKIKTNVIYSIVSMGESLYGKLNKMEKWVYLANNFRLQYTVTGQSRPELTPIVKGRDMLTCFFAQHNFFTPV